jgi:hypothetical protein
VIGDRARGAVLYAVTAVLLAGGATWWLRAAPQDRPDPTIEQWRQTALQLLPDQEEQDEADTLALAPNTDHQVLANLDSGNYRLTVVCVGANGSQVRVSLGDTGTDSGRGLDCGGGSERENFDVGTSGELRIYLNVSEAGAVVFRYTLVRNGR